ncbi:MAG: S41 family peptidase [Acidobacteria bacterium]|nr:S41 family peptidase [Acidobacteriota bacterium]
MNLLKSRFVVFLSIILASSAVFGQTIAKNDPQKPKTAISPAKGTPATVDTIQNDLREALSVIQNNYAGAKTMDYNEVFKSSIGGMLNTLDPHSHYFDAAANQEFQTDQSSRYYGIGATIGDLSDAEGKVVATYIKSTFEGSPAHRAGLRYGDKIVSFTGQRVMPDGKLMEVKDESMLGKTFTEVRSFLRGPEGTPVKLTIEHLSGKVETVSIIRAAVPQPSITESYMIRPGIGYMAMNTNFNQTTFNEFLQDLRGLKAAGMQQLILDLRGNGGGLVSQAYHVASAFLNYGQTVFTQRGRIDGVSDEIAADNRYPDRSPLVVLVDRNTASASEILAGALQDHDRALIVGENTFGKGLVQNPFPLEYGSMLLLTIAKYRTPSGRLVQRDYSNGELYNYLNEGGSLRDESAPTPHPQGPESKTDSGRAVYSGGGINPDVEVRYETISPERNRAQAKLLNPVFGFAMEMVKGNVQGLENYKVSAPLTFNYDIKSTDFPVNDSVVAAFKSYAAAKYQVPAAQIDREKDFVVRSLRTELVTAAYGAQTSRQVFNESDNQLRRAMELLPQAKQLAIQAEKARASASKGVNRDN